MWYYILLILMAYIIYSSIFAQGSKSVKKINKLIKKNKEDYKKIDKRYQLEQTTKDKKLINLFIKAKIISEKRMEEIQKELKLSGIEDPVKYIAEYLKYSPVIIIMGAVIIIMGKVAVWILKNKIFNVLLYIGIIVVIIGIACIIALPFISGYKRRETTKEIEKDYPKLLSHLYYYYGTEGRTYLLSDVMGKFNSDVCKPTQMMIDNIIEDCKRSEREALENVKYRYSHSAKIINLADKLMRCSDGFELGPAYIKGLYEQMIAEEDEARVQKEVRKNEIYIGIMSVCMVAVLLTQMAGIIVEMMKGRGI